MIKNKIHVAIIIAMISFIAFVFLSFYTKNLGWAPILFILPLSFGLAYLIKNKNTLIPEKALAEKTLINMIAPIILILGFIFNQVLSSLIFLAEVWIATILAEGPDSKKGKSG